MALEVNDAASVILDELRKVAGELPQYKDAKMDARTQTKYQRCLARFAFLLERILQHGVQENRSLWGTTNFWNYIENLDNCLPGFEVKTILKKSRDLNKTALGRGRVFLRLALNDKTLTDYLRALRWNEPLTREYYRPSAMIMSEEKFNLVCDLIDTLNFPFNYATIDKGLDDPDYWKKASVKVALETPSDVRPGNRRSGSSHLSGGGQDERLSLIIEQAENQAKETAETHRKMLELKVTLEKEKKEKSLAQDQVKELESQIGSLQAKIKDLELEVNFYKQECLQIAAKTSSPSLSTSPGAQPLSPASVSAGALSSSPAGSPPSASSSSSSSFVSALPAFSSPITIGRSMSLQNLTSPSPVLDSEIDKDIDVSALQKSLGDTNGHALVMQELEDDGRMDVYSDLDDGRRALDRAVQTLSDIKKKDETMRRTLSSYSLSQDTLKEKGLRRVGTLPV